VSNHGGLHPAQPFPKAAREQVLKAQLRANLRKVTYTIRDKRANVVAELPHWEGLRDLGAATKNASLAQLSDRLLELEKSVKARGGQVHWARDAKEARDIVARIAKAHAVDELIKVKSITSDEIELNKALEEKGIHAIETDLAELIVQLSNDRPSHILVPAIHRNRAEIQALFNAELPGEGSLPDTPAELAGAARRYLRHKFLTTKMAVSGANFAIAETGTVCVVESEGNGRMCLTMPEVLVSIMGIEKVLEKVEDISVFMELLPRSSTAERMNPYNSFWSGVTPGDGPQEFHLVLLDNGRTNVRAPDAALYPLLGLPERLPRLRTGGRARLRLGVSRPHRRDSDAATARDARCQRQHAARRVQPVRGVLRRVPGQNQHPAGPDLPPHPGQSAKGPHHRGPRHADHEIRDVRGLAL